MDRQQANGVRALLLRDGLALGRAERVLLADEAHEALDVRAAQLLVRACEPRELAQVGVAPLAVPLGEHRQVVVVVGDHTLAEPLQREPRGRRDEPVVPLPECTHELGVALRQRRGHPALDAGEERPLRRGAADQHQRVVGDADERRGEHRQHGLVVVAVLDQAQVLKEVVHLLLAVVALARRAVGRQVEPAQLLLVPLGVGAGGEEEHDLARLGRARVDELAHAPRNRLRLAAPPVHTGLGVRLLVRHEELHRVAEHRIVELAGRGERLELVAELLAEEPVHRGEYLRAGAVVARQASSVFAGSARRSRKTRTSACRKP